MHCSYRFEFKRHVKGEHLLSGRWTTMLRHIRSPPGCARCRSRRISCLPAKRLHLLLFFAKLFSCAAGRLSVVEGVCHGEREPSRIRSKIDLRHQLYSYQSKSFYSQDKMQFFRLIGLFNPHVVPKVVGPMDSSRRTQLLMLRLAGGFIFHRLKYPSSCVHEGGCPSASAASSLGRQMAIHAGNTSWLGCSPVAELLSAVQGASEPQTFECFPRLYLLKRPCCSGRRICTSPTSSTCLSRSAWSQYTASGYLLDMSQGSPQPAAGSKLVEQATAKVTYPPFQKRPLAGPN